MSAISAIYWIEGNAMLANSGHTAHSDVYNIPISGEYANLLDTNLILNVQAVSPV